MRKCAVYRAIAIAHAQQATASQSNEICEKHVRIAAFFLALANREAMRHLKAGAQLSLNALAAEAPREFISVGCLGKATALPPAACARESAQVMKLLERFRRRAETAVEDR